MFYYSEPATYNHTTIQFGFFPLVGRAFYSNEKKWCVDGKIGRKYTQSYKERSIEKSIKIFIGC